MFEAINVSSYLFFKLIFTVEPMKKNIFIVKVKVKLLKTHESLNAVNP